MSGERQRRLPFEKDTEFLDRIKELHEQGYTVPEIIMATGTYWDRVTKGFKVLNIVPVKGKPGNRPEGYKPTKIVLGDGKDLFCRIYDSASCPVFCKEDCAAKKVS